MRGISSLHVPPFAAGKVVETTGAGDAFVGGFAAALADGADPLEAARFGSATAGISVTRAGHSTRDAAARGDRRAAEGMIAR